MPASGDSLKKKVIYGSFWLYMLEGSSVGLRLLQTVILARLLAPEHFGIIAVFFIFSAALERFTVTGFTKALVQQKNLDSTFLDTAWIVSVVRGVILFSLLLTGSSLVVEFFNTPRALSVIRVLGCSILLQGFYNTGTIFFSRDLDFFKQFLWKSSGFLTNFSVSVPLAFILRNEWALVWGALAGNLAELILSYTLHPYRPQLNFQREVFMKLFNYGKWLLLSSMIAFFATQGDKIIITKILGETFLGIYVIAWKFARIPELLTNPIPNALFPAYSKFQDKPDYLKEKYIETLRVISLFYIPLVGMMIVLTRPFISIFLGDQWTAAAVPMQILTFAIGISIIVYISLSLFSATGKTSFHFKINCTNLLALSIFIYPLATQYGINGVAICYLIMAATRLLVWKIEIKKLIGLSVKDFRCLVFPIVNTVFVVLIIMYAGQWISINNPSIFIAAIISGIIIYLSIAFLIERVTGFSIFHDIMQIIAHIRNRPQREAAR